MSGASSPSSVRFPSESISLPPSSTAPSSPVHTNHEDENEGQTSAEAAYEPVFDDEETERRFKRLEFVLEKSAVYSSFLKDRMDEDKAKQREAKEARARAQKKVLTKSKKGKGGPADGSRKRAWSAEATDEEGEELGDEHGQSKRRKGDSGEAIPPTGGEEEEDEPPIFDQPALITGARLKNYQLEGLQWMVSLDQNGISGILADEMGLGKTLQVIAFSAYLRERQNFKPFLIVCPLSVLHNWIDEYHKFAPKIPVCMYHGTPADRAELRRTVMPPPGTPKAHRSKPSNLNSNKSKSKSKSSRSKSRKSAKPVVVDDTADEEEEEKADNKEEEENYLKSFPIVITTYEIIIRDRAVLAPYQWGYIVVDEGHRLKNLDCKLMREIKKYQSAGRMILTGTPLQNNLSELWALLNFVLPDIFDDLDAFQHWFNLPILTDLLGSRSTELITSLHAILKPFLLRRMKCDVEMRLPPKKEYVIYAPLTVRQKEAYECVLEGRIKEWLMNGGAGSRNGVMGSAKVKEEVKEKVGKEKHGDKRKLRSDKKGSRKNYAKVDGDDDDYFEMLERGELDDDRDSARESTAAELGKDYLYKSTLKQVHNMRLQNTVMQLRKVCSHPFLFDWPLDPKTKEPILGRELVNASGKMMVLNRLLRELLKRGHKVLIFSQFTTMLDIIEDWATDCMRWDVCRIDGSTSPEERRAEMGRFQDKNGPSVFLLSTRAGGLGINLTAADTVVFYDQDWNPQMDAQAQDRAHRIGQTRPVLVFRLVSAHTIETKIMQRATEKRKLEALVIAKGKFKKPAATAGARGGAKTLAEMAAALLKLEADKIEVVPPPTEGDESRYQVLSDDELDMLLDRSAEVFVERRRGWTNVGEQVRTEMDMQKKEVEGGEVEVERVIGVDGKKAVFTVFEAPTGDGNVNDALAKMLGEDD
ncbi:SNF2 family DNA-dependent ATPase [Amanita rubescens]|nr:SNF2 family DNA-dependent ATPase [Amanita rubescens]KAF8338509.1 SNF2 family DNA-dependent ATPase [Amanita rubescens]